MAFETLSWLRFMLPNNNGMIFILTSIDGKLINDPSDLVNITAFEEILVNKCPEKTLFSSFHNAHPRVDKNQST